MDESTAADSGEKEPSADPPTATTPAPTTSETQAAEEPEPDSDATENPVNVLEALGLKKQVYPFPNPGKLGKNI